jgi:4-diphosphocytidyl-2-C-methyl-D-erythritol kinase
VAGGGRLHLVRYAPAKLNLTLAVTGRREDGFHSLHSVMVPLTLSDALTLSLAPSGAVADSLRISGLSLSASSENLVLRAIAATRASVRESILGAAVQTPRLAARLSKRIPVAAGLGGGSSDAAAAISAALAIWNAALTPAQATAVAASLGSDVPFFLARGAALITGRGEFVEPLPQVQGEPPAVLLVTPRLAISTASVFAAFAAGSRLLPPGGPLPSAEPQSRALAVSTSLAAAMRSGLAASALIDLAGELAGANELLPAAQSVAPDLAGFMGALRELLKRPVGLSGSGPTMWVLYPSLPGARKAARAVRQGMLDGRLPAIGAGEAFVVATAMAATPEYPLASDHDPNAGRSSRAGRPREVHNGFGATAPRTSGSTAEPHSSKGDDSR